MPRDLRLARSRSRPIALRVDRSVSSAAAGLDRRTLATTVQRNSPERAPTWSQKESARQAKPDWAAICVRTVLIAANSAEIRRREDSENRKKRGRQAPTGRAQYA